MTHGAGRRMYTDYEIVCMVRLARLFPHTKVKPVH